MRQIALLSGLCIALGACDVPVDPPGAGTGAYESALDSPVVINEHAAGSAGWVELYNKGDTAADVSGWAVDDVVGGGAAPKVLLGGSSVPAHGFLVVSYGGLNGASADTVSLVDAAGTTVDSHGNGWTGTSVAGLCFGRQPDGEAWAAGTVPCSRGASNGGSGPPPAATVLLNEFQAGAAGWIELYNAGSAAASLSGWSVDDVESGGSAPKAVGGAVLQPGAVVSVAYGGVNTASADMVRLVDANGIAVDSRNNGYAGASVAGLCFGRQPDGGAWAAGPVACTRDAGNAGGTPPAPAAVVINEFQAGSAGWIELYNAGSAAADLSGWSVDDAAGGGASPKALGAGVSVAAKGFLLVSYGGVNTGSADTVRLLDALGVAVDSHANYYGGTSLAGLCFGRSTDGGGWAASALACTKGASNAGGTPPAPSPLLINEFRPGSVGFVEIVNTGSTSVSLAGWSVDDVAAGGVSPRAFAAAAVLAPGMKTYLPFGGINAGSADEVRLLDPAGVAVDSHANFHGVDACYGADKCYGRVPDGGAWAPSHIPCSNGGSNPATVPAVCAPGTGCDDGNACTSGDACSAACLCTAGPAVSCDDLDPCTTDVCAPASGCAHAPAPDGTACAGGQSCLGGVCGGTGPAPCVAVGGTYKTVAFTREEECRAVEFLNKARYSQMNPLTTTARDIAYDCSPGGLCGYRSAAWTTVAEYAGATGGSTTLTVGTLSLEALKATSAAWTDDGRWYDTVADTFAQRATLNGLWVHFESVYVESAAALCMRIRDTPGAANYFDACVDPWNCGPDGCPSNMYAPYAGHYAWIRGRLTNETGPWKIAIKSLRNGNPALQ